MRRILVLRGGALGDFIVTLPALELLRQRWPDARIELVGNATAAALAVARGVLDAAHSQHEARWAALFASPKTQLPADFAAWLAAFDLVINFWPDPDGDLRGRFPVRTDQTFITAAAMPSQAPAAAHYCSALHPLGIEPKQLFSTLAPLDPMAASARTIEPAIAIHPGSGSERKNWPLTRWLALFPQLRGPVWLILGEAELERWRAHLADLRMARVLVAPSLEELITALAACRLFLGHDSGVSHLAAACGVPCVLLFGPTDPAVWAPPGAKVRVLQAGPDLAQLPVATVLLAATSALADQT